MNTYLLMVIYENGTHDECYTSDEDSARDEARAWLKEEGIAKIIIAKMIDTLEK